MSTKRFVMAVTVVASGAFGAVAASAALASSGVTPANTEAGYTTHPMSGAKTRAEVREELKAFQKNPVSADGWRWIGGEVGWSVEPHKYEFRNGKAIHADNLNHNAPKPSQSMTNEERRLQDQLYLGG